MITIAPPAPGTNLRPQTLRPQLSPSQILLSHQLQVQWLWSQPLLQRVLNSLGRSPNELYCAQLNVSVSEMDVPIYGRVTFVTPPINPPDKWTIRIIP